MNEHAQARKIRDAAHELRTALRAADDVVSVVDRTGRALLPWVSADIWCAVTLDPSTMLDTGGQHEFGFPENVMPRLFEIEHVEQDDVDNIRALARRGTPVSVLSDSTHGHVETSKYYREILRPLGLGDELRVMLREGNRIWGLLVFARGADSAPFTREDVAVAKSVVGPATAALRQTMLVSGIDRGDVPDAPGLIFLDRDHKIKSASPTAERWLTEIRERHPLPGASAPFAVHAIASKAHSLPVGQTIRSRLISRSGGWISLRAWSGEEDGDYATAVSIGPSTPAELIAIILDVYGLTPREREIVQHVLLGRSTRDIANRTHISAATVTDHLKAVFRKTDVRSRGELTAKIFFQHYLPRLTDPSLSKDGRMLTIDISG